MGLVRHLEWAANVLSARSILIQLDRACLGTENSGTASTQSGNPRSARP